MSNLPLQRSTITLRPKRGRDEAFLRMVYESSRDEELKDVLWNNEQQKEAFFRQQFDAQALHFKNMYESLDYDIIEYKGKPAGRLVLSWEAEHLHCVDLAIIPKFRKNRIATSIMESIEKELERRGMKASLMYEKWKPYLEKFYGRYGFITTKEYTGHFYMERAKKN